MVAVVLEATRGISDAIFELSVLLKKAYINTYEFFEILAYKLRTTSEEKVVRELAYSLKSEYPFESDDYVEFMARSIIKGKQNAIPS